VGLVVTDLACLVLSLVLSRLSVHGWTATTSLGFDLVAGAAVWMGIFYLFGLYPPRRVFTADELRRIAGATGLAAAFLTMVTEAVASPTFGLALVLLLVLETTTRWIWAWYMRRLSRTGRGAVRTLVVGSEEETDALCRAILPETSSLVPVARVRMHDEAGSMDEPRRGALPTGGEVADLPTIANTWGARCVLLASPSIDVDSYLALRRQARQAGLELRAAITNTPETPASRLSLHPTGSVVTVSVQAAYLSGLQAVLKRGIDIVGSALGLLVAAPLIALIASIIRVTSPGPILFRQQRVTKGGRVFTLYKFRTMVEGATDVINNGMNPSEAFFKLSEERSLVTAFGRLLRRASLDELPQLWNVLRGEMSLVGPRPLPVEQVVANPILLGSRHDVRAGLTGWWQVNGRSDVGPEQAVQMDLFYIENWSLGLDLYVLLKTVGALLNRRGAY
jgi:exopolysaccharide biosynthesis polyprenyl glycosylphosphotransferase